MTCDPQLLSYYRDGMLSPDERYDVDAHLAVCTACTASLRGLMRLAQVVRSMPMVPVPASLRESVYAGLNTRQQERRYPSFLGGVGRALVPAAVAAAVAVSAIVAFRPGALDLPSKPAPVAASTDTAAGRPAIAPAAPAVSSSQASSRGAGLASAPPVHVPVSQSGAGSLPVQLAQPAAIPEPIARLYAANTQVHDLLGEPSPGSRTVTLLEQSFQGGLAIRRSDTREIYVLRREGSSWSVHQDTRRSGDRISVDTTPPPGAMVPAAAFGSVWRNTPDMRSRLGWAVYEPRGSGGAIQAFEHGVVVWTPHGLLYVLSNDGRWRTFPDATPL